jgi:RHS repeat-associated protein
VRLRFKVDQVDNRAHFTILADDTTYRRFGVRADGGKLQVEYNDGTSGWQYPADLIANLQVNTWYVLQIVLDDEGQGFYVEAYQENNPSVRGDYSVRMPAGKQWRFQHWVYRGNAYIDAYEEFAATQHFEYDELDRLTHAWTTGGGNGAYDRTYTYDEIGNLTAKGDVGSYNYPASGVGSVRPHAVTGTYNLVFNAENKVAAVTNQSTAEVTTFVYDGDGNRVKRITPEGTTYYVGGYYEEFHPAESADAGDAVSPGLHAALSAMLGGEPEPGEPPTVVPADPSLLLMAPALGMLLVLGRRKKRHTSGRRTLAWTVGNVVLVVAIVGILAWFTVKPVLAAGPEVTKYYYAGAQRVAMRKNGAVAYLHGDHLGSTSLATDAIGDEVPDSRVLYYPYGEVRYGDLEDLPTDFGFTGQRVEESLGGLMDYNARYYDPALGRFVSADTIVPNSGNPQNFNRFTYVLNNP